jgi:hypothetical protein
MCGFLAIGTGLAAVMNGCTAIGMQAGLGTIGWVTSGFDKAMAGACARVTGSAVKGRISEQWCAALPRCRPGHRVLNLAQFRPAARIEPILDQAEGDGKIGRNLWITGGEVRTGEPTRIL